MIVAVRNKAYNLKTTWYHNAKIKNRRFKYIRNRESRGKLAPK